MRIAVVSCWAYRDAWPAFFALFRKYWPTCPYPISLIVDRVDTDGKIPPGVELFVKDATWCSTLAFFADSMPGQKLLLLQEDFLLTHAVEPSLIAEAVGLLNSLSNLGAVRLFPCPGAIGSGTLSYDRVERNEAYRNSLQATIWKAEYLRDVAANSTGGTAADFEIHGTAYAAKHLKPDVMAFRCDLYPFPIQYLCSAISRGKWEPAAKQLCDAHGIEMDWSRGFRQVCA